MEHHHGSILATVCLTLVIAVAIGMFSAAPLPGAPRIAAPLAEAATSTAANLITGGLTYTKATTTPPLVTYTFFGYVANIGGQRAGVSNARLRVDFLTGSSTAKSDPAWDVQLTASTSLLGIGGSQLHSWSYATTTQTTGLYEVCADVSSQVGESVEFDNCVWQWF